MPSCRARTVVAAVGLLRGSAWERLEEAIRCTCGGRGGRLYFGEAVAAGERGAARCFLFHV